MSEYTSEKRRAVGITNDRELAEDYLSEKGYEKQTKPREVNGGRDRVDSTHTVKNKERLNGTLADTPTQTTAKTKAEAKTEGVVKEKSETPFPIAAIICLLIMTAVSLYVVHLYIRLEDMETEINECNNTIVEIKNEERVLRAKKARMYDLEEIERIAREKYGMVDEDQLRKEYITPETEDSIEIVETSAVGNTPDVLLSGFASAVSSALSLINLS